METLALTNATLIDVDEGAQPNATITISGDRIQSVSFGPPPADLNVDRVFDLQGRFLLPGLINCHYHASYGGFGGPTGVPLGMDVMQHCQTRGPDLSVPYECARGARMGCATPHVPRRSSHLCPV